jgi:hypothetical protein
MKRLLFVVLSFPFISFASPNTELLQQCHQGIEFLQTPNRNNVDGGSKCLSTILDVTETYKTLKVSDPAMRPVFCEPANATPVQRVFAVTKWLENNPIALEASRVSLVLKALVETYPCR